MSGGIFKMFVFQDFLLDNDWIILFVYKNVDT